MNRLLARTALAVDRGGGDGLGPAGGEDGAAANVERLFTDLGHAAGDDVVDDRRIEVVALLQRLEDVGTEIGRMPVLELAVAAPGRGPHDVDDDSLVHEVALFHSLRPETEDFSCGLGVWRMASTLVPSRSRRVANCWRSSRLMPWRIS